MGEGQLPWGVSRDPFLPRGGAAGSASFVTLAHSNVSVGIGHFGRRGGQVGCTLLSGGWHGVLLGLGVIQGRDPVSREGKEVNVCVKTGRRGWGVGWDLS